MMGQNIHAGTNNCEILLDEDKLFEQLLQQEQEQQEPQDYDIELDMHDVNDILNEIDDEEVCDIDSFKMSHE